MYDLLLEVTLLRPRNTATLLSRKRRPRPRLGHLAGPDLEPSAATRTSLRRKELHKIQVVTNRPRLFSLLADPKFTKAVRTSKKLRLTDCNR